MIAPISNIVFYDFQEKDLGEQVHLMLEWSRETDTSTVVKN